MIKAKHIYQISLDDLTERFWVGDGAAVAALAAYPHHMATLDGTMTLDSPEQMIEAVGHFRAFLAGTGATEYHRICTGAEFTDDGNGIFGTHMTYVLRGTIFAVPPYANTQRLVRSDHGWLSASITADVQNRTCSILSPAQLRARRRRQTPGDPAKLDNRMNT